MSDEVFVELDETGDNASDIRLSEVEAAGVEEIVVEVVRIGTETGGIIREEQ